MKTVKKILYGLLALILVVVIAGAVFLNHLKTRNLPDYNENVTIKGLTEEVSVFRDEYGIPHIYAKNESDLYKAVGYAMAQDRMWQMDLLRRVTTGRLSEIFGADMLQTDQLMRSLQMTKKSQMVLDNSDANLINAVQCFADGVNQYIQDHQKNLSPEFAVLGYKPEAWETTHSINLIGYMAWDLNTAWSAEILLYELSQKVDANKFASFIPDLPLNKPVFPDFNSSAIKVKETLLSANEKLHDLGIEVFSASNNWAVSGAKSETGMPLVANDMHLGLFAPGIWYQMHQVVEGKFNVSGLVLPGQPMVIAGHNDSIAWGMTNVMLDGMDFYKEEVNEKNEYLFNGEWKALEVKKESIKTKDGEIVEKVNYFTHRGPIISGFKDIEEDKISMKWVGFDYSNELRSVYLLNKGKNWADFRNAVSTFGAASQNIIYGDVKGNIGLNTCASVAIRKGSGIQIYPGTTDEYDWKGYVPFEELPFEFNPERGYVSSANNKTAPDDYPYYISTWFETPHRIDRIREMLEEREVLGIADFKRMHADFKSKHVEEVLPHLLANLPTDLDEEKTDIVNLLKGWDGIMAVDSKAAAIFELWYKKLVDNTVKDEIGEDVLKKFQGNKAIYKNFFINVMNKPNSPWFDDVTTDKLEVFTDINLISLEETLDELAVLMGDNKDEWRWGKIHTLTLKHPMGSVDILAKVFKLNSGPWEVPGSFHTVCPYAYTFVNPFEVNHGASHRHIFDVTNWDNSLTVIPTGTSGIPASEFYCDQTKLYLNNEYHGEYFSKEKVMEKKQFEMKFVPEK